LNGRKCHVKLETHITCSTECAKDIWSWHHGLYLLIFIVSMPWDIGFFLSDSYIQFQFTGYTWSWYSKNKPDVL
jgi:hypothetical protein